MRACARVWVCGWCTQAVAALRCDTIYQFGELMDHPVMRSLRNSEHSWLLQLLASFCDGDAAAFNHVLNTSGPQVEHLLSAPYWR